MLKPTRAMSDRHESHLASLFKGRMTRGSGNQARDQMDGKQEYRSQAYVFSWDGKATLGKSIGVTLQMWEKAKEQAHWAIPILPLRWYTNERLTSVEADLVVIEAETLADLQRDANACRAIRASAEQMLLAGQHEGSCDPDTYDSCSQHLAAYDRRKQALQESLS